MRILLEKPLRKQFIRKQFKRIIPAVLVMSAMLTPVMPRPSISFADDSDGTYYGPERDPRIENLELPESVTSDAAADIKFSIINLNDYSMNNAVVDLLDGAHKVLKVIYLGSIQPGLTDMTISYKFTNSGSYIIRITYDGAFYKDQAVIKQFDLVVSKGGSAAVKPLTIENLVYPVTVMENETTEIKFSVMNTNSDALTNLQAELTDENGTALKTIYIGAAEVGMTEAAFTCGFTESGAYYIKITYDSPAEKGLTAAKPISITVTLPDSRRSLEISNISFPAKSMKDEETEIKFDIINKSDINFKNAEISIFDETGALMSSSFLGDVAANSALNSVLKPIFKNTGEYVCSLILTYNDNTGKDLSVSKTISINVSVPETPTGLSISNLTIPEEIKIGVPAEISFDIVNKSGSDFKNVEATIYGSDGRFLDNAFAGSIAANSAASVTLSPEFLAAGTNTRTLKITYNDKFDKAYAASFDIPIYISASQAGLKIQNLIVPAETLVKTAASVEFAVTNTGNEALKGVEAYIYDAGGNEINSVYISVLEAYSTSQQQLSVQCPSGAGTYAYSLTVYYGSLLKETRSFNLKVVAEKVVTPEPTPTPEPEEDGRVKIQKIDTPAVIFLGVKTSIPFTLANAGKGGMYNVEIFITDVDGIELAREYVGNIAAANTGSGSFSLIFPEGEGEWELTFHVYWENGEETTNTEEKAFSVYVQKYRASVTDITGYEYLDDINPTNIEFSLLNSGSAAMMSCSAALYGNDDILLGELYIGGVAPGEKKERQRFRNVVFTEAGTYDCKIVITYENEDMRQFSIAGTFNVTVQSLTDMWGGEGMYDGEVIYPDDGGIYADDGMLEGGDDAGSGAFKWKYVYIAAGAALLIVIVVVIIAVRRGKKRKKSNDDDISEFLSMLKDDVKK